MSEQDIQNAEQPIEAEEPKKRRGGRRPKAEIEAAVAAVKPHLAFVQYQDTEIEVGALMEAARNAFRAEKKRTPIKDLKLYIKPEERAAYYVINEKFDGKIEY